MGASIVKDCNNLTNGSSEVLPLLSLQYIREPEHDNNNDHEDLISPVTMQQKELDNYNPLQRFEYPLSSNTPLSEDNDNINKKKSLIVDEECRTRMSKWCTKVSEEVLYLLNYTILLFVSLTSSAHTPLPTTNSIDGSIL